MKITAAHAWVESFALSRPYTIAFKFIDRVENVIVRLETASGLVGLGAGSPEAYVTGETIEACQAVLVDGALDWLIGQDISELAGLCKQVQARMPKQPAARAAVDMALYDLLAQHLGQPLVRLLGQEHTSLPTSITIGIMPLAEMLTEAEEHLGRGFRILKVKIGLSLEEDIEKLTKLREKVGSEILIRVDPNQGYTAQQVEQFIDQTIHLDLEFLEQPMPASEIAELRALPEVIRQQIALDESLLDEYDALNLLMPTPVCGIFNIKLMKCGGITPALRIATLAEMAGIKLMWGCMDESIISITAALHAAFASSATRYLDLDGSLDLARDIVTGGFVLEEGYLSIRDLPG
ncbi:MAG: dipeptide epimerase, partial [Anaerolineae bacterium]|nr:dipeptide epimerase [Gloeobacterales cyanobacterium ES-bin-313]